MIKECRETAYMRPEVKDVEVAKRLWEFGEKQIEALEKEGAVRRANEKKEQGAEEKDDRKASVRADRTAAANGAAGRAAGSRRTRKAA